jgi:c-di-GMP-related signal transduction protein
MTMENVALARQPILDRDQQLVAYELLFRRLGDTSAMVSDNLSATAQVVNSAFSDIGIAEILGPYQGFVNVDAGFLHSEFVSLLPPDKVVLELLEDIDVGPDVVKRCTELRAQGYRLALDDFDGGRSDLAEMLTLADIVKVDLTLVKREDLAALVAGLRRGGRLLLAEKVETLEQFQHCHSLGFDLFQGYHFARPQMFSGRRASTGTLALLQLLSLAMGDAEIAALELQFKRHPHLSVNLMRMVNSAASGLRHQISSLRQAIVMLGRRRLQAWLQLLVYTAGDSTTSTPLLQLASGRGRLLELVAQRERPGDREYHDWAFMAGILSLMDALLELQMEEIVAQLNLADAVRDALLARGGGVGRLLALAELLEADDQPGVDALLLDLALVSRPDLIGVQLEAFQWANAITGTVQPKAAKAA